MFSLILAYLPLIFCFIFMSELSANIENAYIDTIECQLQFEIIRIILIKEVYISSCLPNESIFEVPIEALK